MLLTSAVGLSLAAWTLVELFRTPLDAGIPSLVLLVVVLVVGELLPITIPRQGRESDEITISTTFAIALLLVAPIGLVVLAQALPMVYDDCRRRKHWSRPLFNTGQYALSYAAARGTFCLLTGEGFLRPGSFGAEDLAAAFAAGLVFVLVNHAFVSTAIALATHEPVVGSLLTDLRFQLFTGGVLVLLAPLVVVANDFALALVPVLILPVAAVRISAQLATQRMYDALHDGLTSLPNRALLQLEVDRLLREAQASGDGVIVVLADLDHFKEINDTLGHHVGDLLLVEVAQRLAVAAGPAWFRAADDLRAPLAVKLESDAAVLAETAARLDSAATPTQPPPWRTGFLPGCATPSRWLGSGWTSRRAWGSRCRRSTAPSSPS